MQTDAKDWKHKRLFQRNMELYWSTVGYYLFHNGCTWSLIRLLHFYYCLLSDCCNPSFHKDLLFLENLWRFWLLSFTIEWSVQWYLVFLCLMDTFHYLDWNSFHYTLQSRSNRQIRSSKLICLLFDKLQVVSWWFPTWTIWGIERLANFFFMGPLDDRSFHFECYVHEFHHCCDFRILRESYAKTCSLIFHA